MVIFMTVFFRRWSISKAQKRILLFDFVYDVRVEKPAEERYLVHVFMTSLNDSIKKEFSTAATRIFRRRPSHIKVDVLLYKMAG